MLPGNERIWIVWLCLASAGCGRPPEVAHPAARADADDPEAAPAAAKPTGPVFKYPAGDPNLPGDADYRAADRLLRGDGVDVNYAEAFVLIKRAAELKHVLARARLAMMLTWSDYLILPDEAEAKGIFRDILAPLRELARAGDAEAEYFLGCYFESDWCPTPDVKAAIKRHEKAAAKGYDRSEALLAARMIAGDGVPKDASAGLDRLRVVAARGSPAIQERLAGVLWGLDRKAHAKEAFGLCRAAAKRNEGLLLWRSLFDFQIQLPGSQLVQRRIGFDIGKRRKLDSEFPCPIQGQVLVLSTRLSRSEFEFPIIPEYDFFPWCQLRKALNTSIDNPRGMDRDHLAIGIPH